MSVCDSGLQIAVKLSGITVVCRQFSYRLQMFRLTGINVPMYSFGNIFSECHCTQPNTDTRSTASEEQPIIGGILLLLLLFFYPMV